ncbi:MAG TPA: hypothetical protein PKW37_10350, partial [Salinivirgaceae bacterium]|nr:hypothetical protein [Salinivirgaceae bacterium]
LLSDLQSPATPLPFANVSYQLGTYRNSHPASLIPCPTYKIVDLINATFYQVNNSLIQKWAF